VSTAACASREDVIFFEECPEKPSETAVIYIYIHNVCTLKQEEATANTLSKQLTGTPTKSEEPKGVSCCPSL
jgi:hypothetical protein